MATERSHREVKSNTKYQVLKQLEEVRIKEDVSHKINVVTSTLSTWKKTNHRLHE